MTFDLREKFAELEKKNDKNFFIPQLPFCNEYQNFFMEEFFGPTLEKHTGKVEANFLFLEKRLGLRRQLNQKDRGIFEIQAFAQT